MPVDCVAVQALKIIMESNSSNIRQLVDSCKYVNSASLVIVGCSELDVDEETDQGVLLRHSVSKSYVSFDIYWGF
jgi:hypothetical protein